MRMLARGHATTAMGTRHLCRVRQSGAGSNRVDRDSNNLYLFLFSLTLSFLFMCAATPGVELYQVYRGVGVHSSNIICKACKIVGGQRHTKGLNEKQITSLLKFSCQRPREQETDILQTIQQNNYENNPYGKEFGINIDNKLASVEARVLPPPWSEMKAEIDRFSREKKELAEQMQEIESQLDWLRSERDDEIAKLSSEKKVLHDRLHDAEAQLSQLKSQKRDELNKVVKEKNALAERLKNAEAARKRFDEELKRFATEIVTREEIWQSLENEVRRLTQAVGQTEGEKQEKEEQVARCEAYIDNMESKLQACQSVHKDHPDEDHPEDE